MGNFHYFPNHKGELIEYTMNFLSVFIFANIILSYLVFFEYLKKRLSYFNIKFALGVLILLVTANNTPLLLKIIENRTNKGNYLYSSDKLKTFVEVNTINKNEAIITDNFITFSLLNSIYFDKIILLADNVHRIHEWRLNEDIYINSYVGIKQPTNLKFSGKNISIEKKKILEGVKPIKFFSYKKTIN